MRFVDLFVKQLLDYGLYDDEAEANTAVKEYTLLILNVVAQEATMLNFDPVETYGQIIRDDNTQSFIKIVDRCFMLQSELKQKLLEKAALKLALAYVQNRNHRKCDHCKEKFEKLLYPVFYRLHLT